MVCTYVVPLRMPDVRMVICNRMAIKKGIRIVSLSMIAYFPIENCVAGNTNIITLGFSRTSPSCKQH